MKSLAKLLILAAAALLAATAWAAEHAPNLDELVASTEAGQPVPLVLFLDNRLTMDDIYPVAVSLPMDARREYVVQTLQSRFKEMGSRVMDYLETEKKNGHVTLLRPLWILNAVRVTGTADLISALDSGFPEVTYIAGNPDHENTLDNAGWGVRDMQAPQFWTDFGADGSGVIVGHKDAGLDLFHPGFAGHLWINPGEDVNHDGAVTAADSNGVDDDGDGYVDDFWGWGFDQDNNDIRDNPRASQNYGHGTKTASVISANFTPCDTVSVAPGAKIMELSAFLSQAAFWEASQYAILKGAQVISSSVSYKQSDCQAYPTGALDCPNRVAHRIVCEMELAAGLIHANSTGNQLSPNVPLSLAAPSDCPPPAMTPSHPIHGGLSSIIGVNAYSSSGGLSSGAFGPSAWSREDLCVDPRMAFCGPPGHGNSFPYNDYPYHHGEQRGLSKPDITAPTITPSLAMRSQGSCSSISGTSGATPHVGGACALIYSKFPGITPEAAYLLIVNSAVDAGAAGFDTVWGFGKIRPYGAATLGVAQMTLLSGTVSGPNGPLADVRVSAEGTNPVFSGTSGNYSLWLQSGTHNVRFEKEGLSDSVISVNAAGGTITQNVTLITGPAITVTLQLNPAMEGAGITVLKLSETMLTTDVSGVASFEAHRGLYRFVFGELPYRRDTLAVVITPENHAITLNLLLSPRTQPTGPDSAGYFIYDNFDTPAAAFDWVEINPNAGGLPGQQVNTGGDGVIPQTLPFMFRFYGTDYSQISISANGFIVPGTYTANLDSDWAPQPIPSTLRPNGYMAPWWADWEPQHPGGRVLYYSQADSHRVIVEWFNVENYDSTGRATFQAILYDPHFVSSPTGDGVIRFQYNQVSRGIRYMTIGLEKPSGTDGVQYGFQWNFDTHAAPIAAGRSLLITSDTLATNVADPSPHALPEEYVFNQNYPNPFNPTTTFSWSAPRTTTIRLALYDVLGREAAVIFDGVCPAGVHTQSFDATRLTTGVYFARLETQGHAIAVRKVLLLK
ncbi:MAG TPA: S8 family serine peptidase [bacterium]|jgi:hypothetical protein